MRISIITGAAAGIGGAIARRLAGNADTYRPLEVYTTIAVIYFAILFPATLLARRLERGMSYEKV